MDWNPFLKYPYTRLRDLGFPPVVQTMSQDDANALLAAMALAAVHSGQSPAARTKQILEGGPKDPVLTPRQHRTKQKAPEPTSGASAFGMGKGTVIGS